MEQKFYSKPLVRYIIAGASSYAIELSCLLALHRLGGLSVVAAAAIAFWIGLLVSFVFQKLFAFQDYQKNLRSISRQIGRYAALILVNYIFTLCVVALFPPSWIVVSRTLALIIVTCWNYLIYKRFIFESSNHSKKAAAKGQSLDKLKARVINKNFGLFLLLSAGVLAFFYQYLTTGNNKTIGGDFDYYNQLYEAFRISVLKFHQLPLWNPWMSGGIPLFANPQFGLFSIQSILVLPFGAIYGLKLAYVIYALFGFWGMYFVGRRVLEASKTRSALVGYIWLFSGFFAGHNIAHFTFTSFFLLPWLVYFIARRREKYSWLWLGVVESVVILSSIHYAFLMMTLMIAIFFIFTLCGIQANKSALAFNLKLSRKDVLFVMKAIGVVIVLAGYQFIVTYSFIAHNQRLTTSSSEVAPTLSILFQALFLPIGTIIHHYPKTTWGWGEYSMYIGLGTGIAVFCCLVSLGYGLVTRSKKSALQNRNFVLCVLGIGLLGLLFALGDFGRFSPFHLLHLLPGFTQTRVPSRWEVFTIFAVLIFLLAWKRNKHLINALLLLSVIELFISYGPTKLADSWLTLPTANFASSFTQYDNGLGHIGVSGDKKIMDSYYYTTSQNIGQVYADDSLINTMSGFSPLPTDRCAYNDSASCAFVTTHNAKVVYWSPNKILLTRTGPGLIQLNMNVEAGWQINGSYPFYGLKALEPIRPFILPGDQQNYSLRYAPKFSPSWVIWHVQKL